MRESPVGHTGEFTLGQALCLMVRCRGTLTSRKEAVLSFGTVLPGLAQIEPIPGVCPTVSVLEPNVSKVTGLLSMQTTAEQQPRA